MRTRSNQISNGSGSTRQAYTAVANFARVAANIKRIESKKGPASVEPGIQKDSPPSTNAHKSLRPSGALVISYAMCEIPIGNVKDPDSWDYDKIKAMCKKVGLDSSKSRSDMLQNFKYYLGKRADYEKRCQVKFAQKRPKRGITALSPPIPSAPPIAEARVTRSTGAPTNASAPIPGSVALPRIIPSAPPIAEASAPPIAAPIAEGRATRSTRAPTNASAPIILTLRVRKATTTAEPAKPATTVGKFRFLYCSKSGIRKTLCACKDCGGGSQLCTHLKQKHKCKECKGPSLCSAHGNQKSRCLQCFENGVEGCGGGICEHRRERWRCHHPECEKSKKKRNKASE
jgi:hypothetical protein